MLAIADRYEDPLAFIDAAMTAFDAYLESDPTVSPDAATDRRIAELLEEEAA